MNNLAQRVGSAWTYDDFYDWINGGGIDGWEKKPCYDDRTIYANAASLDLRLDNTIRFPAWYWKPVLRWFFFKLHETNPEKWPLWGKEKTFSNLVIRPGQAVLASSVELVHIPNDAIGILYSRSSMGRMLLEHAHAGFVDCGFSGTLTFEMWNQGPWPIRLQSGQRLIQLAMFWCTGETARPYNGRYQNQLGPTPPR